GALVSREERRRWNLCRTIQRGQKLRVGRRPVPRVLAERAPPVALEQMIERPREFVLVVVLVVFDAFHVRAQAGRAQEQPQAGDVLIGGRGALSPPEGRPPPPP